MKTMLIYVADDGKKFNSQHECEEYEKLIDRVNNIMIGFRPNKDEEGHYIAVQQDKDIVNKAYDEFLKLCEEVFGKHGYGEIFKKARENTIHPSHLSYTLSDWSDKYPVIWATYCRFENISLESGIEYTQPYYATHEDEYKWEIH